MVGEVMRQVISERRIHPTEFIPVASLKSKGRPLEFEGSEYSLHSIEEAIESKPDYALFSAGGEVSRACAPHFVKNGTVVIDNSSAWRMDEHVKLIVPEVNGHLLEKGDQLIANPNCSTIQLVMILKPLSDAFGLDRVLVSTYQSVTGTGKKALDQLRAESKGEKVEEPAYPHAIHLNALPHCDVFEANAYTREEMKLFHESRKILGIPQLPLSATAVRIPVVGGHAESVTIDLKRPFDLEEIKEVLSSMPGVIVEDEPSENRYPMPINAHGKDEVWVGRMRRDVHFPQTLHLFIVADNLRKGAATNAVQIMEQMMQLRKSN